MSLNFLWYLELFMELENIKIHVYNTLGWNQKNSSNTVSELGTVLLIKKRIFSLFSFRIKFPYLHSKSIDWFLYEDNTGI